MDNHVRLYYSMRLNSLWRYFKALCLKPEYGGPRYGTKESIDKEIDRIWFEIQRIEAL